MGGLAVEVVNIVAGGDLRVEVDIEELANDSKLPVANYEPENNATFLRFEEDGELIILYTSGKYILRGGDDFDTMYQVNDRFLSNLTEMGLEFSDPSLEVKNVVSVGELEKDIELNALMIALGLEDTEYEPEQFPGLIYRPDSTRCVLLVFSSGKVVITGGRTAEEDEEAFLRLQNQVNDLL
ncbi:TATA-box-binding protein [Halanaeroarchaeum sulfurireducens]|uniref:Transcription factor n=1 Tax=Halanaeroarchaeum sulfurireducens TaxID=1604004 RepID=A0A0F7PHA1_9EURY|nr:TATA-box-binding protein [Halanaeroarchaeum sulfurireducens]AKH98633.1 transcription factor [Halanaeroarchaeum sulfurireducens]ALG83075.1 transcription factor [Halanaeroarchaeum sulfurireducens]